MAEAYTRDYIIRRLEDHFNSSGFKCEPYSDKWQGEVRLPLYCLSEEQEELVIDVITDAAVSEDAFFPEIEEDGVTIVDACAPRFFQYYLPYAKVYWAYGYYVNKDTDDYENFKKACMRTGIGLLEVSDKDVIIVEEARPLMQSFSEDVEESTTWQLGHEYIHRFVYYANPLFRRREITGRQAQDLSIRLVDELRALSNLEYRSILVDLAEKYRHECRDDPEIARDTIRSLWKSELRVDYPDIHKEVESVLLLDPKYRDHYLHQFQVFLLGATIIDKLYNTGPIQTFEQQCDCKLEYAWLAASTYHDFNYAIQDFKTWTTNFLKKTLHVTEPSPLELDIEKVVLRDEFLQKIQGLFKAIGCDEIDDHLLRFILGRVALDKNHAVIGAFTFLNKFKGRGRLKISAANHAAASILLHDEKNWRYLCGEPITDKCRKWEREFLNCKLLPQLRFDTFPLAFLLAFCDSVQEWGREGRDYNSAGARLEEIELDDNKILIVISLANGGACRRKLNELKQLGKYLNDQRFGIRIKEHEGTFDELVWMTGS